MSELRYVGGRFVCDDTPEEKAAFAEKARSLRIAPSAMVTRSGASGDKTAWAKMEKDLPAYKRLRDDGLQPPSVRGSADLEARAEDKADIESAVVT
tara:strand:- start:75 stop:362 length:288 start_codon:yes stop_codon:yes gene_type:complete